MKRIEPYYFLIGLAAIFVIAGMILYSARGLTLMKHGDPIEPLGGTDKEDLFELWFTGANLLDLSVDRNVTGIIFGSESKKVSLLDRERKLRWEKSFPTSPLQTKISACGNYLAVGTEGGDLFFMSADQQVWWQQELEESVYLVTLSANGKWVLVARGAPEQDIHHLELYDGHNGSLQWSIATGPLQKIYLAGEQLNRGLVFYSYEQEGTAATAAAALTGENLWVREGVTLEAISRTESRLALLDSTSLIVCRSQGEVLWERTLPAGFNTTTVMFNPQNSNLLLYGSEDRQNENLYYFSAEGKDLWRKKIAEGALLSFAADGNRIITSSWRHYKEDFSQMVFLDETGEALPVNLELGMRVERLLVSSSRRYIVIGGEDGFIDVIDLDAELFRDNAQSQAPAPLYSPAVTDLEKGRLAVTLFFNSDDYYIPVSRLISQTDNPLRTAIEELIRGPSRESGLNRTIPKDAAVEVTFKKESGQLFLALSPEMAGMTGAYQPLSVINSLSYTIGSFAEVKEIYITAGKEPLETFGNGVVLEQPIQPHHWKDPLFIPVRISERYYIIPREASELEIEQRDLDGLLMAVVKQCRSFYFVPGDLNLIEVSEADNVLRVDLNSSFRMLFPEDGGVEEQLHAAMVLDALFLTAAGNSDSLHMEIYVEGEKWSPPQDYPSLDRSIYRPYHINPEF